MLDGFTSRRDFGLFLKLWAVYYLEFFCNGSSELPSIEKFGNWNWVNKSIM